jgi:hypothetical protein
LDIVSWALRPRGFGRGRGRRAGGSADAELLCGSTTTVAASTRPRALGLLRSGGGVGGVGVHPAAARRRWRRGGGGDLRNAFVLLCSGGGVGGGDDDAGDDDAGDDAGDHNDARA